MDTLDMCAKSRNAVRLLYRDGAVGDGAVGVVARDEAVKLRPLGERHSAKNRPATTNAELSLRT